MRKILLYCLLFCNTTLIAQSNVIGRLEDPNAEAVIYANVGLFAEADSSLVKVQGSDDDGKFNFVGIPPGNYYLMATYIGFNTLYRSGITVENEGELDLGTLQFKESGVELNVVQINTQRSMVVVKPDRTIFNVQGTINSTGSDAIALLRKAPAVTVDNQDNVSVLGRNGVRVFVDGKSLPLEGEDLSNYLKNLPADQIDRIEIITSPGAKYEAEGNAGIIDIRLKKDENIGANGSLSGTFTQGIMTRYNLNGSGNYRNKRVNVFGNAGYNVNDNFHDMVFQNYQNDLFLDETNNSTNLRDIYNFRLGTDVFLNKNHTIGFLAGSRNATVKEINLNQITISQLANPSEIDSVLIAENEGNLDRDQYTFNLNYRFNNNEGQNLSMDLDYGRYRNDRYRLQPNRYYSNVSKETLLSENIQSFVTPTDIDIYTAKLDYEKNLWKGKVQVGSKISQVNTRNKFEVFDEINGSSIVDSSRSNLFDYDEIVYAGYLGYSTPVGNKLNVQGGIRLEQTRSTGTLTAYSADLQEPPSNRDYLSFFPSAGLSYDLSPTQILSLNYSRRINRPDYNVLNPFRNQLSEISIEKGNPYLNAEFVNNIELGYTLQYKYNFKLAYSKTLNQITRLIGPDDIDPKASFISWDNLATQSVLSLNASLPISITKWWSAYLNLGVSHIDNQADYGEGAIVDVKVFSYSIYQSQTFSLPKGFKAEISGYFSGPGVWGGVFRYDANWVLDVGLKKSFFNEHLQTKLSASNIFNRFGWRGESSFNGLTSKGSGSWDNTAVSLSLAYNFGNQNIKSSKRKTSLEEESKRVK